MQQHPTAVMAPPIPPEQCGTTKTVAILDVKFGVPGAAVRYIKVDPDVYAVAYDRDLFNESDVRTIMRIALRADGCDNADDIEFIGPDEIRSHAGVPETMAALPGDADDASAVPTIVAPPRTWTFQPPEHLGMGTVTEVCPSFCRSDHGPDQEGYTHPSDVWHQQHGPAVVLRLSESEDAFEQWRVMETQLTVRPHSPKPAEQVPHVDIEYVEGVWTGPLDPDGLGEVIDKLATHVDNLRVVHTQLVKALAEHQAGAQ